MAQARRAKMHSIFIILSVLSVVVMSCDEETHYINEDDQCCKMCGPGKRMMHNTSCRDPVCQECGEGEYQEGYTKKTKCERQPSCDPNLNFQKQNDPSKIKLSPCQCIPDHHCASTECNSCVRNTVCKAGERVSKMGKHTSDTECERCPNGTFSDQESAPTCKPWTKCLSGYTESVSGSSTSDRTCKEAQMKKHAIVISVVFVLFLVILGVVGYLCYRKGRTGSVSLIQKTCGIFGVKNAHQPVQDQINIENGPQQQPVNQPQEDTEDLLKLDVPLTPGISENGLPVIQDHSKSSLLSQPETEPESYSEHL